MAGELIDPLSAAGIAQQAVEQALAALQRALSAATAASGSATAAAAAQAAVQAFVSAFGVTYRWSGTSLQIRQPDGTYGALADLQGPEGAMRPAPTFAIGTVTVGDTPSFVISPDANTPDRYIVDLVVLRGAPGQDGEDGTSAWTPVLSIATDGARRVFEVTDWTGGTGAKPAAGLYLSASGFTATLSNAIDVRGPAAAGAGNVNSTGTVTAGHVVLYADGTGDVIADGGALGNAATRNVGTSAGTVAAGDDSRIIGAAPLASPAFTGTPTAPTATSSDSSTTIATTAFVHALITALIGTAPAALDTLGEIATQLANDESAASALTTTVAGKLAKASNLGDLPDKAVSRTNLGVAIGSNVQAWDADLDAIAALTTTAFGRGLLTAASAAALKLTLAIAASDVSGLATVATSGSYNDLSNKPTISPGLTYNPAITSAGTVQTSAANYYTVNRSVGAVTFNPPSSPNLGDLVVISVTGTGSNVPRFAATVLNPDTGGTDSFFDFGANGIAYFRYNGSYWDWN